MDWRDKAVCRDHDGELWFPLVLERGSAHGTHADCQTAVTICRSCPAREDCLLWAQERGVDHGIWGGLTPEERRLQAAGHAAAPPPRAWAPEDDHRLVLMAAAGQTHSSIAAALDRSVKAVETRLRTLRRQEVSTC